MRKQETPVFPDGVPHGIRPVCSSDNSLHKNIM